MAKVPVGIDAIALSTTHYELPLRELAQATDVPVGKYHVGLGQVHMSVPALDEDAVTLGAEALAKLLGARTADAAEASADTAEAGASAELCEPATKPATEATDTPEGTAPSLPGLPENVRSLFFATESSVDQSKAGGVFMHSLLGLPRNMRTVEFKQACYGGTAALQAALALVARNPEEKVLVVAADVARYAADSSGEPTQGAGAVAMLISAHPRLLEIDPATGVYTLDINDFWRPNDSSTPYVLGHLSMDAYMDACLGAWDDLAARTGLKTQDMARFVHHQPFGKMSRKAHARLMEHTGDSRGDEVIESGLIYGRDIGNTYTAALYIGLASLLANDTEDLTGQRIGLFSYGSGAVSEFFTGTPVAGYREELKRTGADRLAVETMLATREEVSFATYRALHGALRTDSANYETPRDTTGPFRFAGVQDHARRYERTGA
ncbi:hydroxymethylglutaryl-CoA synthase [Actinobaculum suis]|uniref:Hydroxymethylglutaryl-CoA synthase n=1 Tax=Actinobaculum suis TaxID=1657 RepID=A0A7Z8Y9T3_9ACTO|nr:hydroxymethylglutaryl-CoA synthase [Actinobaculum suis]VDG76892.1 hydroxymethylglutaryl-CoA synthase [Actinobaculum suis]